MDNSHKFQIGDRVQVLSQHGVSTEHLGIHYSGHCFKAGDIVTINNLYTTISVECLDDVGTLQALNISEIKLISRTTSLISITNKQKKERLSQILKNL